MNLHSCDLSGVDSSLIHGLDDNHLFSDFNIARAIQAAFCVNEFGQLTYINEAMCCLTNYSREELLGMKLLDINASIRSNNWSQTWRKLKSDDSIMFLSHYLTKANHTIDVQVSIRYVKQNGIEFGCGFVNRVFDQPLNCSPLTDFTRFYIDKYALSHPDYNTTDCTDDKIYLLQFDNWHIGEV